MSTPRNPPGSTPGAKWNTTTAVTATARRPSSPVHLVRTPASPTRRRSPGHEVSSSTRRRPGRRAQGEAWARVRFVARAGAPASAVVGELQRDLQVGVLEHRDDGLQVVPLLAGDPQLVTLDLRLHALRTLVPDQLGDLPGVVLA